MQTNNSDYTEVDVGKNQFLNKKALVIEDNDLNKKISIIFLEDMGFTVDAAKNGSEGIAMFNDSYDLVLLDIGLPDMDGFEVCKELRKLKKSIPIVACTAHANEKDCFNAGIDDHIQKPVIFDELKEVLAKCLL